MRRLRAVAAMDVVGYSRLMSTEESRTHSRVNALFSSAVKPVIESFGGFQIERSGDGLLVLFESSTDAVRCALDVQKAVARQEVASGAERKLQLRIGVNMGDIIMDGEEIAGDDVNIAVRLQTLAEPGTVCISGSVRAQLHGELDGAFEDLGDVALKNIARPVRAYQLRLRPPPAGRRLWALLLRQRRHRWAWIGLAALVLLVASRGPPWGTHPAGAAGLPPMSIAVLPFRPATIDVPAAAGRDLTAPLVHALASTGWLDVRDSEFVAQVVSQSSDAAMLGSALNVRYAVLGRVDRRDGQFIVDVQLMDTASRTTAWSTRLTSPDDPAAAGRLSSKLVVGIRQAVFDAESKRFSESKAEPRTALEHMIRGDLERQRRVSLEDERRARVHYERAVRLDPNFVQPMISLAYVDLTEADLEPGPLSKSHLEAAEQLSKRVVTGLPDSAPGWQLRAEVLGRQWLWDAALDASARSLVLDPARAYGSAQRASLMLRLGRPAEALALTEQALLLTEQRPGYVQFQRCRALMALGEYARAVESCEHALSHEDWWLQRAYLVAANALRGVPEKATQEKARLERLLPHASIQKVLDLRESDVPAYRQQLDAHLLRGLRLAGLPEGP